MIQSIIIKEHQNQDQITAAGLIPSLLVFFESLEYREQGAMPRQTDVIALELAG